MKKSFFPHSFTWVLYLLFIATLTVGSIIMTIFALISSRINYLSLITGIIAFIFLSYQLYVMIVSYKINLDDKTIYSNGDKFQKIEKVQYKCSINFSEISDIKIISSSKNSLNKQIQLRWISSTLPKKYLEFTLFNGQKERIWINQYTKKQIIKLLNIIIINIKENKNTNNFILEDIMKDWYSYEVKKIVKNDFMTSKKYILLVFFIK